MHKTSTRLADGRELIYYRRGAEPAVYPPDLRELSLQTGAGRARLDAHDR